MLQVGRGGWGRLTGCSMPCWAEAMSRRITSYSATDPTSWEHACLLALLHLFGWSTANVSDSREIQESVIILHYATLNSWCQRFVPIIVMWALSDVESLKKKKNYRYCNYYVNENLILLLLLSYWVVISAQQQSWSEQRTYNVELIETKRHFFVCVAGTLLLD